MFSQNDSIHAVNQCDTDNLLNLFTKVISSEQGVFLLFITLMDVVNSLQTTS